MIYWLKHQGLWNIHFYNYCIWCAQNYYDQYHLIVWRRCNFLRRLYILFSWMWRIFYPLFLGDWGLSATSYESSNFAYRGFHYLATLLQCEDCNKMYENRSEFFTRQMQACHAFHKYSNFLLDGQPLLVSNFQAMLQTENPFVIAFVSCFYFSKTQKKNELDWARLMETFMFFILFVEL